MTFIVVPQEVGTTAGEEKLSYILDALPAKCRLRTR